VRHGLKFITVAKSIQAEIEFFNISISYQTALLFLVESPEVWFNECKAQVTELVQGLPEKAAPAQA